MSYYNYIDHPRYGRIWFEMTIRNWYVLGHTEEQNLDAGPCCEIVARDYAICGGGKSPQAALENLMKYLEWHADEDQELPVRDSKPYRSPWWKRWKLHRLFRRMRREGKLCRITNDTGR